MKYKGRIRRKIKKLKINTSRIKKEMKKMKNGKKHERRELDVCG
jgi:hypothetical protein